MMFWRKKSKESLNRSMDVMKSNLPCEVTEEAVHSGEAIRSFERWVDEAVSEHERGGGFADLPGKGKPIPQDQLLEGDALTGILKNARVLPPWLELRLTIRDAVLEAVSASKRESPETLQAKLEEINALISRYNRMVPSFHLQRSRIYPETLAKQPEKWE